MKIIVSLTSIYDNLASLQVTLQSLLDQSMKPDSIRLYLSEEPYLLDKGFTEFKIPPWLDEMPIELRWVKNIGPYRKILPILFKKQKEDVCIITADDDVIYHPDFVKRLVETYEKEKCCVAYNCSLFSNDSTYITMKKPEVKSVSNFHKGNGGVLYHPSFFEGTEIFSDQCLTLCPTNDDIWLNFWRMRKGVPCYWLDEPFCIKGIVNEKRLWMAYNQETNDDQIKKTHSWIFSSSE